MSDAPKCEPCTHFTAAVVYQRGGWYREKCNKCGSASRWVRSESAARYALRGKPTPYHAVVPVDELATLRAEVLGLKGAVASVDEDNDALRATVREQATKAAVIHAERDAAEAVKQSLTTELDERRRQYKDDMHAAIVEVGRWSQRSGQLEAERDAIALAFQKLGAVLRVNMLRWAPDTSHAEIDSAIDACLGPAARAAINPDPAP